MAGILQSVTAPYLNFNQVHPNLVMALVFGLCMIIRLREVLALAFFGGLILDLFSGIDFGLYTLSMLMMAILAGYWQTKQISGTPLPILLIWPYTVIFNLSALLLLRFNNEYPIRWGAVLTQVVFVEGLLNVAAMLVLFPLILWSYRLRERHTLRI